MRPSRLEIEGFTAFRERTVVEFDDADLFVLCGPTGSGKSSLIDAMTFALYGSVPRYNHENLIYSVVSQGLQEARVRFDFMIQNKPYTAVRVIRRQKRGDRWGAVTKEARLESGKRDLAASAKELNEQVLKIFGLNFVQFTTCVVLPQGDFARFLHSTPADRQGLLKELLRIYIYGEMGQRARQRNAKAKQQIQSLDEQIDDLLDATPQAKREVGKKVKALSLLRKTLEEAQAEIEELEKHRRKIAESLQTEEETVELLKKIKQPENVKSIVANENLSREDSESKTRAREKSEKSLRTEEAKLHKLPDPEPIRELIKTYGQLQEEQERFETAKHAAAKSHEAKKKAEADLQQTKEELKTAETKVQELQRNHLAYQLAEDLAPGQDCPVCFRPLDSTPQHSVPANLEKAKKAVEKTIENLEAADKSHKTALSRSSGDSSKVQELKERLDGLSKRLKGKESLQQLEKKIELITAATERVDECRDAAEEARHQERLAQTKFQRVQEELKKAWTEYDKKRDLAASLQPPAASRDDLNLSWTNLIEWAAKKLDETTDKVQQLTNKVESISDEMTEKDKILHDKCTEADVEVDVAENIRDAVVEAHARAEEEAKQIEQSIKKRESLNNKKEAAKQEAAVSGALARHLSANAFERWLLQEAFDRLVIGASQKLLELSSGDYSFNLDDRLNFDIVDHRNADEIRSSRTLSGGETFLASLALALTLSEQIADLATDGAARLESIFLDEGFGSLDPATLEMVASTIEDLGAKGRTVGVITHVKDLADRIPVQYHVSKGPKSALVERVAL